MTLWRGDCPPDQEAKFPPLIGGHSGQNSRVSTPGSSQVVTARQTTSYDKGNVNPLSPAAASKRHGDPSCQRRTRQAMGNKLRMGKVPSQGPGWTAATEVPPQLGWGCNCPPALCPMSMMTRCIWPDPSLAVRVRKAHTTRCSVSDEGPLSALPQICRPQHEAEASVSPVRPINPGSAHGRPGLAEHMNSASCLHLQQRRTGSEEAYMWAILGRVSRG